MNREHTCDKTHPKMTQKRQIHKSEKAKVTCMWECAKTNKNKGRGSEQHPNSTRGFQDMTKNVQNLRKTKTKQMRHSKLNNCSLDNQILVIKLIK